jgi:hypothetical protein
MSKTKTAKTTEEGKMQMQKVKSSCIKHAGYSKRKRVMMVILVSGQRLSYPKVPPSVWEKFLAADSKGSFWNTVLKAKYGAAARERIREARG